MKKISNLLKLDFMIIKPYITFIHLFIFLAVTLYTSYSNASPISSIILILMFTMLYASYPFAIVDQNGVDSLYTIFGLNKKDVIKGRYAFLLAINILGATIGIAISFILSMIFKTEFILKEVLIITISTILALSTTQFIQYPILFKNGYLKSKATPYLPFAIVGLIVISGELLFKDQTLIFINKVTQFFVFNPILGAFGVLIIWLVLLFISYRTSYKYYIRREF
ncbi:ABC-2 transporter permease [Microaceticoccus formicicus]|uniref:ABC-2 transporter permease n=1 Tax=Microaceticoccus formicicus TaxID=3118105 RepID=UPI003CD00924|nr:ABC-2 transporter permease [Peptoniphilaceae bacterium AMB_02]